MTRQDFIKRAVPYVINEMGETRRTRENSIVFPNGWVASIVKVEDGFSVAVCDYDGYFNWDILKPFGTDKGTIICKTEDDICRALTIIELLK